MATLVSTLSKDQLEGLAVEAIRKYRDAIETEERAFAAWQAAEAGSSDAEQLRVEYVRVKLASRAQQLVLASLIEALGFVPDV